MHLSSKHGLQLLYGQSQIIVLIRVASSICSHNKSVRSLYFGDGAGNTVDNNSSVFSLMQMVTGQLADATGDCVLSFRSFGGICETASCPVTIQMR